MVFWGLEPPTSLSMLNAPIIWAIGPRESLGPKLMFWNIGSGGIDIFLCKVDIWNINCTQAKAFAFDSRSDVLIKVWNFLRQKISRPKGGLESPTFGFMLNAVTFSAIRARHFLAYVSEHWLWRFRYFRLCGLHLKSGLFNGNNSQFWFTNGYFCEHAEVFETQNVSDREGLETGVGRGGCVTHPPQPIFPDTRRTISILYGIGNCKSYVRLCYKGADFLYIM